VDFEAGKVYPLDIFYTGGGTSVGPNVAGFNLKVDAGHLQMASGAAIVRLDPSAKEATHTSSGAQRNNWQVNWKAPSDTNKHVTFILVVNVVNGDGTPGDGDGWGKETYTIGEPPEDSYNGLTIPVLAIAVVVGIILYLWLRKGQRANREAAVKKSGKGKGRRQGNRKGRSKGRR
jgi:hypothetical protein